MLRHRYNEGCPCWREARIQREAYCVSPAGSAGSRTLLRSNLWQDREREDNTIELLDTLGYQPLAITQAAAFISENIITLAENIETLQSSELDPIDLLSKVLHDPKRNLDCPSSVVRTW